VGAVVHGPDTRGVINTAPVVFLVLPITILFAFWPGVVGLSLTTP